MFKPDLGDLGFIPVVATNPETASEFRSLFAGSFLAYAYFFNTICIFLSSCFNRNLYCLHYDFYCLWTIGKFLL